MEKVSILMPNYNHETHLREAIVSCLNQTYKNIELIIADSSTDNSIKVLEEFKDDKRVSIYHKNEGTWTLPQKLNFLINKASGEYFKFFWSDDIMIKDCVEKNLIFAKKNDLDFVNIDMTWIDYEGKVLKESIKKKMFNIKSNLISENPEKNMNIFIKFGAKGPFAIGPNSLFGKLQSLKKIGRFNENYIQEDVPFVYKMYSQKFRIGYINEPLWQFRYFDKENASRLQGQKTAEHFEMRIYCMNLAIKSGMLNKETKKIAKKRINTYKAEIFQSRHKYLGLILLFYRRYQPILVKYYFISKKKNYNVSNYLRHVISDFQIRVKMMLRGLKNPQRYY